MDATSTARPELLNLLSNRKTTPAIVATIWIALRRIRLAMVLETDQLYSETFSQQAAWPRA